MEWVLERRSESLRLWSQLHEISWSGQLAFAGSASLNLNKNALEKDGCLDSLTNGLGQGQQAPRRLNRLGRLWPARAGVPCSTVASYRAACATQHPYIPVPICRDRERLLTHNIDCYHHPTPLLRNPQPELLSSAPHPTLPYPTPNPNPHPPPVPVPSLIRYCEKPCLSPSGTGLTPPSLRPATASVAARIPPPAPPPRRRGRPATGARSSARTLQTRPSTSSDTRSSCTSPAASAGGCWAARSHSRMGRRRR